MKKRIAIVVTLIVMVASVFALPIGAYTTNPSGSSYQYAVVVKASGLKAGRVCVVRTKKSVDPDPKTAALKILREQCKKYASDMGRKPSDCYATFEDVPSSKNMIICGETEVSKLPSWWK